MPKSQTPSPTGRLSRSEPEMQNIPGSLLARAESRRLKAAREKMGEHVFLKLDFSGLEVLMESQLGVNVRFKHTCGHTSPRMLYSSGRFAESDRADQEARQCSACDLGISPEEYERRAEEARRAPFDFREMFTKGD